jgi:hypothetical protein
MKDCQQALVVDQLVQEPAAGGPEAQFLQLGCY